MHMLAPVNHILGLTNIRRIRTLPVNGNVLVRVGQRVNASDVIAEAQIATRHVLVDVRRAMGGATAAQVDKTIVRAEGDKLQQGDVIAETGGIFSRIVRAPSNCTIAMISGGRVLLAVETQPLQLLATIPGVVTDLHPERGATIETNGALIQGAWGNGRVAEGLMIPLLKTPDEELTTEMLEVSLRGAVVVGGFCRSADVLRAGAQLPLRGLVLASMTADLLALAAGLEYPIVVLEGFGRVPLNDATFQLITTSEKRDASLNAVFNPPMGEKPELILPLPAVGQPSAATTYFAPDQTVRIQGEPYRGKIGVIVQIRPGMTVLPNGLRAPAADVRLDRDSAVIVPLANLEVIE
jgi:hypothetical protein